MIVLLPALFGCLLPAAQGRVKTILRGEDLVTFGNSSPTDGAGGYCGILHTSMGRAGKPAELLASGRHNFGGLGESPHDCGPGGRLEGVARQAFDNVQNIVERPFVGTNIGPAHVAIAHVWQAAIERAPPPS